MFKDKSTRTKLLFDQNQKVDHQQQLQNINVNMNMNNDHEHEDNDMHERKTVYK